MAESGISRRARRWWPVLGVALPWLVVGGWFAVAAVVEHTELPFFMVYAAAAVGCAGLVIGTAVFRRVDGPHTAVSWLFCVLWSGIAAFYGVAASTYLPPGQCGRKGAGEPCWPHLELLIAGPLALAVTCLVLLSAVWHRGGEVIRRRRLSR